MLKLPSSTRFQTYDLSGSCGSSDKSRILSLGSVEILCQFSDPHRRGAFLNHGNHQYGSCWEHISILLLSFVISQHPPPLHFRPTPLHLYSTFIVNFPTVDPPIQHGNRCNSFVVPLRTQGSQILAFVHIISLLLSPLPVPTSTSTLYSLSSTDSKKSPISLAACAPQHLPLPFLCHP